jgi:hypothetical protein
MEKGLFNEKKIFFQINRGEISIVNNFCELDLFRRISQTEIPTSDDPLNA